MIPTQVVNVREIFQGERMGESHDDRIDRVRMVMKKRKPLNFSDFLIELFVYTLELWLKLKNLTDRIVKKPYKRLYSIIKDLLLMRMLSVLDLIRTRVF